MELIDTPNPNAKKIETEFKENDLADKLNSVDGVISVFFGPGFITITKSEDKAWDGITQDISSIFDKL